MTKVQIKFKLSRALSEPDLVSISRMHSVYGFNAVRLNQAASELLIEYDASRLSRKEVRASLEQHGLPVVFEPSPASVPASDGPPAA